ncbi:serine/threonine-protein kinase 11-interacting protein isoform X2 [Orussus abietinus]|uniref:serine/threonine-protein kinase 11-interacting protein isoform X2 n=1 Tax=Orussus abietinus TaxID=222816 RepID=UPI000625F2A5|nr:serine/threonine-protein kinase 11-interacting protein isoform X2 [Orussus abietinus]
MSLASKGPRPVSGMQEITELAKLLRQNGDKVLSAMSKLTLSTTLLSNLNDAFSIIVGENDLETSFQVCNSSKIDLFRDLKFLHDFVQKTVALKVTHNANDAKIIDITKFRHLKYLELQKVCIEHVRGMQAVRSQLENVVCTGGRGVSSIKCLLEACGGDAASGFVWGALQHLSLTYNALVSLDQSLELTPWLQTLDLSHNSITNVSELEHLPNLKNVNLGYNKLEAVPIFNKAVFHMLQILILKNNYIECINGLHGLESLTELDLSYNCLTEHRGLWPLEGMSSLLRVSLKGNPLSYHRKHRLLSLKHLHPTLSNNMFVLDNMPLSKTERQIIAENRTFSIKLRCAASKDDINSLAGSITSDITATSMEASFIHDRSSELTESVERAIKTKRKNVKEAVIAEIDPERNSSEMASSIISSSQLELSMDHLETKRQILALREKFGEENWLSSQAGTYVQDIMGLQRISGAILSSTPIVSNSINTVNDAQTASLNFPSSPSYLDQTNIEYSKDETLEKKEEDKDEKTLDNSIETCEDSDTLVNESVNVTSTVIESPYDPTEENGDLYLVQKKVGPESFEEVFLVITSEDVKERDSISGKVKYRWATNTVLSCVMGRGTPTTVDIIFDTTRKDRQNRVYIVEPDEAKKIVATFGETLSVRPIILKIFKCMKCSTHFSQDEESFTVTSVSASGIKSPKCPACQSTLVIETDELSTPDVEHSQNTERKAKSEPLKDPSVYVPMGSGLRHSGSHSSIGSATSLDESRESTPSTSTIAKKYESDIEVLSNPSQSSIEVLDEGSKPNLTPNRKRSSEERRVAIAPSLLTIPDTTPVMTGLTESSSSGSFTDSVCTTYENKSTRPSETNDTSNARNNTENETVEDGLIEKETSLLPVTNLTSMLGGLLQSMRIGTIKPPSPKSEDTPDFLRNEIQYSYTDYSNVDHRIKLHIILNVFEQENEELVLLLRADILMPTQPEVFPGCLVLSTSKVYVLRIIGPEGEDPQRWLHKEIGWTMNRLRSFTALPFKQGILIEVQQPNKPNEETCNTTFVCILQDIQRTSNFFLYITDLPLPSSCEVEFNVPSYCTSLLQNQLQKSKYHKDGERVRLFAAFSSAILQLENRSVKLKSSALIITSSALIILDDKMQWLLSASKETPSAVADQAMSNLIEVEYNDTSLNLNFLDEIAGTEETWIITFVSTGAADAVISSIQPPWEELFSVPLQIATKTSETVP